MSLDDMNSPLSDDISLSSVETSSSVSLPPASPQGSPDDMLHAPSPIMERSNADVGGGGDGVDGEDDVDGVGQQYERYDDQQFEQQFEQQYDDLDEMSGANLRQNMRVDEMDHDADTDAGQVRGEIVGDCSRGEREKQGVNEESEARERARDV
jgi:hypothetical protein